ncbi:MAG: ATP-binding cassette domain-containing protein [Candidatus Dojkabacteria bacterium]|nr:MAG: ATP-binding cassette domain-containing protein [Candidatus Dojkabacteria bacterium]
MLLVSKLSKFYQLGGAVLPVLKNVSFTLDRGEFVFLTGASGSGKTTLIKLLIRQELPTKGSIVFETVPIEKLPRQLVPSYRRTVGVVFQDYKLLEHKNVYENVAFVLEILNKTPQEVKQTVEYLLDYVGLADKKELFPKQLSGGEKRRVVIARAIANNPKLLIADEPTGDLDPDNSNNIMELLSKINKAGTSVMMTTHNLDLVERFPHSHWHLDAGELNQGKPGKSSKKQTFMQKLAKLLPDEIMNKLEALNPEDISELLSLTPSFFREELKFTDKEITLLTDNLKKLA